jgi:hypothetical protein
MDRIVVVRTAACEWPLDRVPEDIVSKALDELKETKDMTEKRVIQVHGKWPKHEAARKSSTESPRYYIRVYRGHCVGQSQGHCVGQSQQDLTPTEWLESAMDQSNESKKRPNPVSASDEDMSEPAAKRVKTAQEDTNRQVDRLLMEMLFPPVPKPEPFALMTPMHDSMRTWIKTNFLENKNLEVALVSVPKGLPEGASLLAVREWRDAQREGRPPKNVDASDKLQVFVIPDTDPRVGLRAWTHCVGHLLLTFSHCRRTQGGSCDAHHSAAYHSALVRRPAGLDTIAQHGRGARVGPLHRALAPDILALQLVHECLWLRHQDQGRARTRSDGDRH